MKFNIILLLLIAINGNAKIPPSRYAVKQLINKERHTIKKMKLRELSILKKIDLLQREIFQYDSELIKTRYSLKEKSDEVNKLNLDISNSSEVIDQQKKLITLIANKIIQIYGPEETAFLESLFNSGNLNNLVKNLKLSEIFMLNYFQLLRTLNTNIQNKELEIQKIESSKKEIKELHLKQASILNNKKGKKKTLLHLLERVENEKASHLKYLQELRIAQKQLDKKFIALNNKRTRSLNMSKKKGKLIFPLTGKVISRYGRQVNKKFNTIHFNKGITITSQKSDNVKAINDGTVIYANWFKGYGNIIILNHGNNYYSLYARTNKLLKNKGNSVKAGETIAVASKEKGKSLLYFELRHKKQTLNPLRWLKR